MNACVANEMKPGKGGAWKRLETAPGDMAEANLGVFSAARTFLGSAAAAFAFGEAASFAVQPSLTEDLDLLSIATKAAARAGSTGLAVVTSCLVFTSALLSLGAAFLLSALVMKLLAKAGVTLPWMGELTTGSSAVVGAVAAGTLVGFLPAWMCGAAQGALVLGVYSCSNISDMSTALLIIFTTLYVSVACGRMGALLGILCMGLTITLLFVSRRTLTQRSARKAGSKPGCKLLERIFFYSVFVGILGFFVGLGSGGTGDGSAAEVLLIAQSVVWVGFLSAGLLGAGLGTVSMVGMGPEMAGRVAVGAAVLTSASLRAVLHWGSSLGPRSCTSAALGAAAAAGVALGAASVAAKPAFGSRHSTLAVLASVAGGAILGLMGWALRAVPLSTSELIVVAVVAAGAFILGAPKSPFHTQVNLQSGLLTGAELVWGIGMETVTAAAAPIGAGALGAAALGTAALGTLGAVGVLLAILLALGSALSGMLGKSPETSHSHTD